MEEMSIPHRKILTYGAESGEEINCNNEELEYRIITKGGNTRWVRHTCRPIVDENGVFLGRRGCRSDITEHKQLADQVSHMVLHDLLTGLPNRSLFADRLFLATAQRERGDHDLTVVLFFGIDRFKLINDTLGHETGDRLLIMVAERLRKLLHPNDTLCRFGGDVFAFILPGRESRHEAVTMSYRVLAAADPFIRPVTRHLERSIENAISPGWHRRETCRKIEPPCTIQTSAKNLPHLCPRDECPGSRMLRLDTHARAFNGDFYLPTAGSENWKTIGRCSRRTFTQAHPEWE